MHQASNIVADYPAISIPADPGETLFVEGDPCDHTLEVRSGIARATLYSSEGDRQIMAFFFPGDLIGLPLSRTHRYSAEAVSSMHYVRHSANGFAAQWTQSGLAADQISRAIWREEQAFITRGLILGRVGVQARLGAFLSYIARRLAGSEGDYDFPIPHGDIASYLATSPETICRTLRRLREDMPRKNRLKILDERRLTAIAEGG